MNQGIIGWNEEDAAAASAVELPGMETTSWTVRSIGSEYNVTWTIEDQDTGELVRLSTSGSLDGQSSTTIAYDMSLYQITLLTEYHHYGLKIKIKLQDLPSSKDEKLQQHTAQVNEEGNATELDACAKCAQLAHVCAESPACFYLEQCMQDTIHLKDSLQSLSELSPGSYLNATMAARHCHVDDAYAWHTLLNRINCEWGESACHEQQHSSPTGHGVRSTIVPGMMQLRFVAERPVSSRIDILLGGKRCPNAFGKIERIQDGDLNLTLVEPLRRCLQDSAKIHLTTTDIVATSTTLHAKLHLEDYIGPMPSFQLHDTANIRLTESYLDQPQLIFQVPRHDGKNPHS